MTDLSSTGIAHALARLTFSIEPVTAVADVAEAWQSLQERADVSFFLTWDWIGRWLIETGERFYLLSGTIDGQLVALALLKPISYRRHIWLKVNALMLHQVGDPDIDVITIEHNGFLVDRAVAEPATLACIEYLQRPEVAAVLGQRWDELHCGGVAARFETLVQQTGLMVLRRSQKPSWAVDLEAIRQSGRSYLDHISANTRYQIRRSIRRYERRGPLTATRARDLDEAMRFYQEMQDLHQRYWINRGEPGSYAFPFYKRFHQGLISQCVPKGTVELVRVAAGDFVIGYVYNFVYQGNVSAYHTGLAYDEDPKLKPGLVSHYLCIERHIRENARVYDFLAGDNRYKANLGDPGTEMLSLILQRPIAKLRVENALRRVKGLVAR